MTKNALNLNFNTNLINGLIIQVNTKLEFCHHNSLHHTIPTNPLNCVG